MKNKLLLLFIPTLTLILCVLVVIERNPYCASWSDPTYCYLFNGLNIATGYFKVGQVDHPGTPLQLFAGFAIRFFHLFREGNDVVQDVISNEQWYLFRICILQSVIIAGCMFAAGQVLFHFTQNILYSLIIQLTHLISFQALFFSQNLMTEFILVITLVPLAPLLVIYSFSKSKPKIYLTAAFICGIMISGKISSFPVLLLWIFILRSNKERVHFILIFLSSFLLCTIPAWHAAGYFFSWLTNITTHTGTYGSGENGFVIWSEFFKHLRFLLTDNWFFTANLIILFLLLLKKIVAVQRKQQIQFLLFERTLSGILLASLLELFMVSKHFGAHYVIPVHMLVVPSFLLIYIGNVKNGNLKAASCSKGIYLRILILVAGALLVKQSIQYHFYPNLEQPAKEVLRQLKDKKYDLVLFSNTITAPLPQPALLFGVNYAGDCTLHYKEVAARSYPPYYIIKENGKLQNFNDEFEASTVLNDSATILYYAPDSTFKLNALTFNNCNLIADSILFQYTHPVSKESVYLFKFRKK